MRKLPLFLVWLVACSDPTPPDRPGVAPVNVTDVVVEPAREVLARTTRFGVALSDPASLASARALLVRGTLTDTELSSLVRARPSSALAARVIASTTWVDAERVYLQPDVVLEPGTVTLVVAFERGGPLSRAYRVGGDDRIARRLEPAPIWCVDSKLPALPTEIAVAPKGVARVRVRDRVPCFELVVDVANAIAPPAIGELAIEPALLSNAPPSGPDPEPCAEDAAALSPICARVLDDRFVFVGDVASPRAIFGALGDRSIAFSLAPGARTPIVGWAPNRSIEVDLFVRDVRGERRVRTTVRTARPRRHVVVNEVLSHAPSGSSAQRFVELVNDGRIGASTAGLALVDGDDTRPLPEVWLEPGELALVVPHGFTPGLAGDVAPPAGVQRLEVDALKLTGAIAIVDGDDQLSQFPASTSTRTISRGRRTPSTPDDAPNAFDWDAKGRATPGRPNVLP